MSYIKYNVRLTKGQKEKLLTAYRKRAPITLRLKHDQLSGSDEVFLTRRQIVRINKSKNDGTGTDIKISGTQIRKQSGGNLFSTLLKYGIQAIPYAGKAVGSLASGALSGLGGLAIDKLFGSGLFSVPQDKVDKLVRYKSCLTEAQKKQILAALQTGGGIPRFRLTKKQSGGILGTILGAIGIPLVAKALAGNAKALFGRGLQVGPGPIRSSKSVYVPRRKGGLVYPGFMSPPFYGDWAGSGLQIGREPQKSVRSVYVPRRRSAPAKPKSGKSSFTGDCCKRGSGLKKKRSANQKASGLLLGPNSPFKGIPLIGTIL